MGPEAIILTALPADQRPAIALAMALRAALDSPNTEDAGEADAERAAEMLETLQHLGFALLPASPGSAAVLAAIAAERRRQIEIEGWTPEHDDLHQGGELARAAAVYANSSVGALRLTYDPELAETIPLGWPWAGCFWKPKDPYHDLVRAAALIMAELERLDRAAQADVTEDGRHG